MVENIKEEIENKVIDYISSGVAGRLIISELEKNSLGADLFVERRGKYKEGGMYFQINSLVIPAKSSNFIRDFSQESFRADKDFYLIFAYFDEIRQKINDYIWLIPSLQFRDIAEVVKSEKGKNLLRFEPGGAPDSELKGEDKYSKFLVNINELGKLILEALEGSGKFTFKEGPDKEIKINLESLAEFLVAARQNTYASSASPVDNPRLPASIQLEFQKGDHSYRDIYFSGDKRFIGQEIIYLDSKPIWGMNYIGSQIGKLEIAFLKEALFKSAKTCRNGQSCEYEKRELRYQDHGQGSLGEFSGKEEIFQNGKSIYKLNYQGGLISDKT